MIAQVLSCLTILGTWQYAGSLYDGTFYPNAGPLVLKFTFQDNSISHLKWYRENEPGFCERTATYSVRGDELTQKINWVNPENNSDCARDPDMQLNRESVTRLVCDQNELGFRLELNGKEFIYVLRRPSP